MKSSALTATGGLELLPRVQAYNREKSHHNVKAYQPVKKWDICAIGAGQQELPPSPQTKQRDVAPSLILYTKQSH